MTGSATPERQSNRLARNVEVLYDRLGDGVFPEVTYRGVKLHATSLVKSQGNKEKLEGHVLLGALAPLTGDRDACIEHFHEASRIDHNNPFTWLNDANFSTKVGLIEHSAKIVNTHLADADGNPEMLRVLLNIAGACGMVDAVQVLEEKIQKLGGELNGRVFPSEPFQQYLVDRGMVERDLVARVEVAANAAYRTLNKPILGSIVMGSPATGFCYQFMFSDVDHLADADAAIAEAITDAFEDDFSDLITFSTRSTI